MIFLEKARGRDNNFNLIRVVAAFIVLFIHSRALLGLEPPGDPLYPRLVELGGAAVDVFFFTSGFLIAGSLFSRANIFDFVWARFMRVFPGLWAMLLITVTSLGLFVGTLPASEFFASPITHDYFWRCATLINGIRFKLPGVFEGNPFGAGVNGSLWTLPVEWRLYEYMAAAWVLFAFKPSWRPSAFRYGAPLAALILAIVAFAKIEIHNGRENIEAPMAMFFFGAACYFWRSHVRLSYLRLAALAAALGLAALNRHAFLAVYMLTLGPIVLHMAYLFAGPVRAYNRLGDYSYGVYIYAFPIQQSLVALVPGLTLTAMNFYACALSLTCAVLSWRLVEKPALAAKLIPAQATERLFERLRFEFLEWRRRRTA
jgi:peptidoglycan/LPS O-acetylase OafA/YrhL